MRWARRGLYQDPPIAEVGHISNNQICTLCPSTCRSYIAAQCRCGLKQESQQRRDSQLPQSLSLGKTSKIDLMLYSCSLAIPVCLAPSAILCSHDTSATSWNILTMSDTVVDNLSISFKKHYYFYGCLKYFDQDMSALKISFAMQYCLPLAHTCYFSLGLELQLCKISASLNPSNICFVSMPCSQEFLLFWLSNMASFFPCQLED